MEKTFVVCHMFVSMDGKIDGAFMGHPAAVPARDEYGNLRGFYRCDATLYGAVTIIVYIAKYLHIHNFFKIFLGIFQRKVLTDCYNRIL